MSNKKQSSLEWYIDETFKLSVKFERQEISQDEYTLGYSNLLQQAKAMHKEEIESNNKINLAINEFERLKSKAGSIRDIIYLDGVLAVLDSIKNETFGGNDENSIEEKLYTKDEVLDLLVNMNSWPTTFEGREDITEWFEQGQYY